MLLSRGKPSLCMIFFFFFFLEISPVWGQGSLGAERERREKSGGKRQRLWAADRYLSNGELLGCLAFLTVCCLVVLRSIT